MNFALPFANPPPDILIAPAVRNALIEDLGRAGDITTDLLVRPEQTSKAMIAARSSGTIAGLIAASIAFREIDPGVVLAPRLPDGSRVAKGDVIATIEGPTRAILTAERVALNFLGHLSGVATATEALVLRVAGTKARIVCTRKTLPGLRILQKYAVRCGGGVNHRFGLDDAVLVKDNHIAAAGGVENAIALLKNRLGHMVRIEVEVDTIEQLERVLALGIDTVLLDNMTPATLRQAVGLTDGRAVLEASGGITVDTVREIAETGVDYISSGAVTHSAVNLDVGLDFE